jgi:hypothetical protein
MEGLGASGAGADGPQMVVAVDASGVAIGKGDLDGVIADRGSCFGAGLGLEHRQCGGGSWACGREGMFFLAFVVAGGARALIAEVGEIEVAGVAVGPGNVHAGTRGDVDFYGGGFTARVDGDGHKKG